MGLRSVLKHIFFRAVKLYDLPHRTYYASSRLNTAKQLPTRKHAPRLDESTQEVQIWARNLEPFKSLPTFARSGHWAIQVGDDLIQLLLPDGGGVRGCSLDISSTQPTEDVKYKWKCLGKKWVTACTPEEVRKTAETIYETEFEGHYAASQQDCQRLCMRIWAIVCGKDAEEESYYQYFKSFSFAVAYSTMSPPPNITHSQPSRPSHSTHKHHQLHTPRGDGSNTFSGWFLNALGNPSS